MKRAVVAIIAVATLSSAGAKENKDPLAGFEHTGQFEDCLQQSRLRDMDRVSGNVFLVRLGVNEWYLNQASGSCDVPAPSVTRIQSRTPDALLCNLEIIDIVDNLDGSVRGTCTLGKFERLKKFAQ